MQNRLKKIPKNVGTYERAFLLFAAARISELPIKKINKQEVYTMTMRNKQELIQQMVSLLNALIEVEELPTTTPPPTNNEQNGNAHNQRMCAADQRAVRAYHSAVGSSE